VLTTNRFNSLPRLGVGFNYDHNLRPAIEFNRDLINFFEISPDILCRETIVDGLRRLDYIPNSLTDLLEFIQSSPVIVHGLGLSIGSACGWNEGYLAALDTFHKHFSFVWHSEHLAFLRETAYVS
jgi:uncharacterized protein